MGFALKFHNNYIKLFLLPLSVLGLWAWAEFIEIIFSLLEHRTRGPRQIEKPTVAKKGVIKDP